MKLLKTIALACALSLPAFASTIYVPDDYSKIQDAINASVNGDTIIVRPGCYADNLDYLGKAITVRSERGPKVTTIAGRYLSTVVAFSNGEGLDSVLHGFTLRNGVGVPPNPVGYGGGIYCSGASPTISNCIIRDNEASYGGGIYCSDSRVRIYGNVIKDNFADHGGGIYCSDSSSIISGNKILNNQGMLDFGGIACMNGSYFIYNNVIADNWSYFGNGGGVACRAKSSTIPDSDVTLTNNTIVENYLFQGSGAGIWCDTYTPWNCTLQLKLTNCIVVSNHNQGGLYQISITDDTTLAASYSDIEAGEEGVFVGTSAKLIWGAGMLNIDPLFADPPNGDLHLTWISPCRNTGDNSAVTELHDFENDPRIALGTVDMGADEFYYHLYSVGEASPGASVEIKVTACPAMPVTLFLGSSIRLSPYQTQYGSFWLTWPLLWWKGAGAAPSHGVLSFPVVVPKQWTTGSQYGLQALVGRSAGPISRLTNLDVLTIE